jgi:hypothetical protein
MYGCVNILRWCPSDALQEMQLSDAQKKARALDWKRRQLRAEGRSGRPSLSGRTSLQYAVAIAIAVGAEFCERH